ncbi:MAG: hypothetical protein CXT75_02685 [Methanobacteriota archaeon]|nr:MAG: hypothetical protein CXT75_02685 [Euryarchaeota archaeon]
MASKIPLGINWLDLLTFAAAKDPFLVGLFVLFIFPVIGNTLGFIIITLMIILFVGAIWYFHNNQIFAD